MKDFDSLRCFWCFSDFLLWVNHKYFAALSDTLMRRFIGRYKNIIANNVTVLLLHKAFGQCVFGILSKMQVNYLVDKLLIRTRNKFTEDLMECFRREF